MLRAIKELQSYTALLTERIMTAFNLARADNEILRGGIVRHSNQIRNNPYANTAVVSDTWII